ncbi:MAG: flippase-like domain-containing protein [Burkholderiales bacterium]|nr:flippase-like domain-containing protein [Flavobacterium sp.]
MLPILFGSFLIVYTYEKFTPQQLLEIKGYFKNANYSYIYLGVFIAFLGNASRAYRWKFTLEHMGYTTSFYNNFMAVNIGYLLNLTVPKSGEISRAVILKKYENVPFDKGFGTIVAERIVDMIVLLLFMMLAILLQFDIVKSFILDKIPLKKLMLLSILCLVVTAIMLLVYRYSKAKWVLALKQKVSGLKEGVLSIFHMKKKIAYLLHTAFIWFSYILMFYITLFVLPETSSISVGAVVTAFVVGSIAIAFTNSGFGSYPFLISKILLFYSISETAGNAFGWIVWSSQMFLVVVLGMLSFLLLPIFNRSK